MAGVPIQPANADRLLFQVLGSIAEFERDLIRERTAAGMRAAKRREAKIGRPEAAIDRLELVRGIRGGASVSELARRLGVGRRPVNSSQACLGRSGEKGRCHRARNLIGGKGRIGRLSPGGNRPVSVSTAD
jgi:hypothetical protein